MIKRIFLLLTFILMVIMTTSLLGAQEGITPKTTLNLNDAIKAYDSGQYDKAQSILISIVESGQGNEVAYYFLGLLAHDKGVFDKAEQYYRKAIQINPKYALPYSDLSVLLLNQRKLTEAEEMARKATILDPSYVKGYLNLAAIQYTEKKREEAYQSFLAAAKLDPDAVCNLGNQMLKQYRDPGAAIYYYSIVLQVAPNHPFALLNIGASYRMLGKLEQALGFYKRGYEVTPKSQEPFNILYSSYFRLLLDTGQYNTILQTAVEKVGPGYPSGHFFRALAYYQLKNGAEFTKEAKRYFELSCETRPSSLEQWAQNMISSKSDVR
jgi:tetratricopeptide (TPR) repeat protein